MNNTAGPDSLMLTLLVFRVYPQLSKTSPLSPSIVIHAAVIHKAIIKVQQIKAAQQINDMLATCNSPNVADVLQLPILSSVKVW